jgi:hypothetical protein
MYRAGEFYLSCDDEYPTNPVPANGLNLRQVIKKGLFLWQKTYSSWRLIS